MAELQRVGAFMSPFAEARAWLDKWEKEELAVEHIVLICDAKDTLLTVTGDISTVRTAGLCFVAAQMAAE